MGSVQLQVQIGKIETLNGILAVRQYLYIIVGTAALVVDGNHLFSGGVEVGGLDGEAVFYRNGGAIGEMYHQAQTCGVQPVTYCVL